MKLSTLIHTDAKYTKHTKLVEVYRDKKGYIAIWTIIIDEAELESEGHIKNMEKSLSYTPIIRYAVE